MWSRAGIRRAAPPSADGQPAPPPRLRVLFVGVAISSLGSGLTLPFLVVYLHGVRHIPLALAGVSLACGGIAGLVGSPFGGALADRLGPGRIVLAGIAIQGVASVALVAVHSAWQAALVVALQGLGAATYWPAQSALLAALVPSQQRTRTYAVQFMLLNAGIGVGGLVSGSVVSLGHPASFDLVYLADGTSSFVFALLAGIGLRHRPGFGPPAPVPRPSRSPAAGHHRDGDADRNAVVAAGPADGPGGYRAVLADRAFRAYLVTALGFIFVGYAQLDAGWSAFSIAYTGASPRVLGLAFAANTAVIVASQLVVVRHVARARRSTVLAVVVVLWATCWTLTGVASIHVMRGAPATALLVSALAFFGLGEACYSPVGPALVNDLAPDHLRGRYNAVASNAWSGAAVLGAPVADALLAVGSPVAWIGPLLAGCCLTAVAARRLGPRLGAADSPPRDATET